VTADRPLISHDDFTETALRAALRSGLDDDVAGGPLWLAAEPVLWLWLQAAVRDEIQPPGEPVEWDPAVGVIVGDCEQRFLREVAFPAAVDRIRDDRDFLLDIAALVQEQVPRPQDIRAWLDCLWDRAAFVPSAAYQWWFDACPQFTAGTDPGAESKAIREVVRAYQDASGEDTSLAVLALAVRIFPAELRRLREQGPVDEQALRLLGGLAGD